MLNVYIYIYIYIHPPFRISDLPLSLQGSDGPVGPVGAPGQPGSEVSSIMDPACIYMYDTIVVSCGYSFTGSFFVL